MSKFVIAISREFGSGGRLIGEKLALRLGVPFYDRAIIDMASEKSGLSTDFIEKSEERASNSFLYNLSSYLYGGHEMDRTSFTTQYEMPVNDKAFFSQAAIVTDLAKKGNCVIVGRCADYLLRDNPDCIKVFIHADVKDRQKMLVSAYDVPESEAAARLTKLDKGRAYYYKHYTGETWGQVRSHDLCINSSICGINGAVDVVLAYMKAAGKI